MLPSVVYLGIPMRSSQHKTIASEDYWDNRYFYHHEFEPPQQLYIMEIYCTRPHCKQPLNSVVDLNQPIHQQHCANCEMPLILAEHYLPLKLRQQDGLTVTFIGGDLQTAELKYCVIKQWPIEPHLNASQLELTTKRFDREAEVLKKLGEHPRIPRVFARLELTAPEVNPYAQQQFFYLVQEDIQGQNLHQELLTKGKFSETEVIFILREVAKILEFVHFQGAIHRDINPANIIRDVQGKINLINFGAIEQIANETAQGNIEDLDRQLTCAATPEYAPWEQRQGQAIYPSSDLYALAVTCLNLLTGRQAQDLLDIETNNWQWRIPDLQVSQPLAEILNKMLQNQPTERFQSARDVLDVLDATWGLPILSIPPSSLPAASLATASSTLLLLRTQADLPEPDPNQFEQATLPTYHPPVQPEPIPLQTYHPPTQPEQAPLQIYNPPVQPEPIPLQIYNPPSQIINPRHTMSIGKLLLITGALGAGIIGLIAIIIPKIFPSANSGSTISDALIRRSSMGERILLSIEGDRDTDKFKELKRAGVLAIASKNYGEAVVQLEAALKENPNSPETRIYLNNALIGDRQSYVIATSAPIARSLDRSAEMLRGFAQAQAELNQIGDVNGAKLKLRIIDDSDDPKTIETIATAVAKQPEILGIVGHNRNDVNMKAANIYNREKLAFIAPISTANKLTAANKPYIFRTNAKGDAIVGKLVDRLINKDRKRKVAIFYVPTITYNDEFKTQFTNKLTASGGAVVATFPFSTVSATASPSAAVVPTFDAEKYLQKATAMGAEAILLLPVGRSNREALSILKLKASKYPKLSVLSDTALYSVNTLKAGAEANGLMMGVPWQESESTPQFSIGARQMWNNRVNWATATSYNAVKALGTAIKAQETPSRANVMQSLTQNDFIGASGALNFTNGEPTDRYMLIRVSKTPRNYKYSSRTGYDFVPID
jgi:ABC-type branched-subunit amino acid transport system substrate-binding protein/serine/threonine protein kinase